MKRIFIFTILVYLQNSVVWGGESNFYIIQPKEKSSSLLYSATEKISPNEKLMFFKINGNTANCCFQISAPIGKNISSSAEDIPKVQETISDKDIFRFFIRPNAEMAKSMMAMKPTIGFGFEGMSSAKEVSQRLVEITLADKKIIYVKYCAASEGLNFDIYKSKTDKKPLANYYYYLGYDITPNCK